MESKIKGCMNCGNISCPNNKKRVSAGCGRWKTPEQKIIELEEENSELREKNEGFQRVYSRMRDMGFPTFASVKEYAAKLQELEKENTELKEQLKTSYRKGMRHMAKALKDYDRTDGAWTDYFEHTVDKVLQREQVDFEEYGSLADQLAEAKKIILMLYNAGRDVLMCRNEEKAYDNLSNAINDKSIEQFLSEVGK